MNKRQIILDFTSLLDVIMIILFFFILFARLETDQSKEALESEREQLQAEQAECEALKKEAEEKSNKADKALAEYQEALSRLENSGESAAQNVAEMHKFELSQNMKIRLNLINKSKDWELTVFSGNKKIGKIKYDTSDAVDNKVKIEKMKDALSEILTSAGYSDDKTILCEFFYDGLEEGSSIVYPIVQDLFKRIRFSYRNFKVSETDTSIFTQANTTKEDTTNEKK